MENLKSLVTPKRILIAVGVLFVLLVAALLLTSGHTTGGATAALTAIAAGTAAAKRDRDRSRKEIERQGQTAQNAQSRLGTDRKENEQEVARIEEDVMNTPISELIDQERDA